jgi:metal-sulfur cluster biosynthetic enzyme
MKNKVDWAAEKEHPDLCEKIRDALRNVKDPEIGMDLVQLGLIRNVEIEKDKVRIEMILTTPYCPYAPMLMESARKKAEEESGIPTEIFYGKDVWDQTMMEDDTALNWGLF